MTTVGMQFLSDYVIRLLLLWNYSLLQPQTHSSPLASASPECWDFMWKPLHLAFSSFWFFFKIFVAKDDFGCLVLPLSPNAEITDKHVLPLCLVLCGLGAQAQGLVLLGIHSAELYSFSFFPLQVVLEVSCIIQWQKDSTEN